MKKCCYIAIAGRVNSGKTTLFRNLTKKFVGEVADKANVTKTISEEIGNNGVCYMDLPGFQYAPLVSSKLSVEGWENTKEFLQSHHMETEREALKGIEKADVVYYVAPADVVPDESFREEINIIQKIQVPTIGIINKSSQIANVSKRDSHIQQWTDLFDESSMRTVIYDFHWDSPCKLAKLSELTYELLSTDKKSFYLQAQEITQKQNEERRYKIVEIIIQTLNTCKGLRKHSILHNCNEDEKQTLKEDLICKIKDICSNYYRDVSKLYSLQLSDDIALNLNPELLARTNVAVSESTKRVQEGLEAGAAGAVFGGVGGLFSATSTVLGYGVSLSFLGFLAIPVALAAVGGLIGGAYGASRPQEDTLEVELTIDNENLYHIYLRLIAGAWCISHWGFDCINIENKTERLKSIVEFDLPQIMSDLEISQANFQDNISENTFNILNTLKV